MTDLKLNTSSNTINSVTDMCMRPTYKSPNNNELLLESHDNDILPVIELTTINNNESLLIFADQDNEDLIEGFDEKDYDFYDDEKISHIDLEKELVFDEEKSDLIKKEKSTYNMAYKDEKDEENLWILPESEIVLKRNKLWTKPRIIMTMAVFYMICLGASYTYFYHGNSCM
ncbi:hypothetical protein CANINC_002359 [Pichia inconspicua]|uniref:Uncharacterized protein n=1 Tax=Pichia inconspicua TaxID=52247 RepID=A0A4T0X1F1_9ASCO|nr:hypothetical protein CANINC_002359 [[Candida] inconspicua]